jgi:uncharacterized membrane protein
MSKGRLEAFSDGVIAIIITIMVLELKAPHGHNIGDLTPLLPQFLAYLLSFVFIGIYWNNHHHLLQIVKRVNGRVLWANLHLLFWLSIVPFVTSWLGESHLGALPIAMYAAVCWMAGFSYYLLARALIYIHTDDSPLVKAIGNDRKGKVSLVLYSLAIPLAFVNTWVSLALIVLVAIIWFIPDRRIERHSSS